MAEEGAHLLQLVLDRRAHVCRRQERHEFVYQCTRRGTAADPRANLGWVQKGLGQALDKGKYIQRVLIFEPLRAGGALRERNFDASLVL